MVLHCFTLFYIAINQSLPLARPYIGRIQSMWESWAGHMKVQVGNIIYICYMLSMYMLYHKICKKMQLGNMIYAIYCKKLHTGIE